MSPSDHSSINYHPLTSQHRDQDQDPNPNPNPNQMGPFNRFLRFGGWRRNLILLFAVIITFSFSFIFKYKNPPSNKTPQRWPSSSPSRTELSTTNLNQCTPPPGHPIHRYALMIDAGSTGSRIHVYRFSYCLPPHHPSSTPILPTLDHELFFKTQPGLSSYAGRPSDAAQSLLPLLQAASEGVPQDQRHCTPISVKATAGLRLLGDQKSKQILDHIHNWLRTSWPFKLSTSDPVTIMDGADEGVYAWVTINYLLKTIGPQTKAINQTRTAAMLELGGASAQIVFEPIRSKLEPGEHVYELQFGGKTHSLYQHSHLGYGLMEARRAVHQLIAYSEMWRRKINFQDLIQLKDAIGNPCLQPDTHRQVKLMNLLDDTSNSDNNNLGNTQFVDFVGTGQGFHACRRVVGLVMGKDVVCNLKPCAFGGVYQPSFADAFADGPIYALSYIYDRLNPLGINNTFKLKGIQKLIEVICVRDKKKGDEYFKQEIQHLKNSFDAKDEGIHELNEDQILIELDDRPESCLDLTFIFQLLHLGYQIDQNREIIISKKITAIELGWALGAAIDLLEKNPLDQ